MARRWYVPMMALPVMIATVVAVAVGVASASPGLKHPATAAHHAALFVNPGGPMISLPGPPVRVHGTVNAQSTTTNWAGYVLTGRSGAFRSVSASWVQPIAHCAGVRVHRLAAFWVGLDGFGSPSVEQTGADSDCAGRVPVYQAWFELFPAGPVFFRDRMAPGDHMSASVVFRGGTTYAMVIVDRSRRWSHTIVRNEGSLRRASAEVIAEAPSQGGQVLPLANFGSVVWTGSRVNGRLLRALPRRILLTMVDNAGLVKARTSLVGPDDAFRNSYVRAF